MEHISKKENDNVISKFDQTDLSIIWSKPESIKKEENDKISTNFLKIELFCLSEDFIHHFVIFLKTFYQSNTGKKNSFSPEKESIKNFFRKIKIYPIFFDEHAFNFYSFNDHFSEFFQQFSNQKLLKKVSMENIQFCLAIIFITLAFTFFQKNDKIQSRFNDKLNFLYKKINQYDSTFFMKERRSELEIEVKSQKLTNDELKISSVKTITKKVDIKTKSDHFSTKQVKILQIFFEDICFFFLSKNDLLFFKINLDSFQLITSKIDCFPPMIKHYREQWIDSINFLKLSDEKVSNSNELYGNVVLFAIEKNDFLIEKEKIKRETIILLEQLYESELFLAKKQILSDFSQKIFNKIRSSANLTFDKFLNFIKLSELKTFFSINSLKLHFKIAFDFMYVKNNPENSTNLTFFLDIDGFEIFCQILEARLRLSQKSLSSESFFLPKLF